MIEAAKARAGPGVGNRPTDCVRCQVRCRARCLFISNMVTLSLPKTLLAGILMTDAAWAFRGYHIPAGRCRVLAPFSANGEASW